MKRRSFIEAIATVTGLSLSSNAWAIAEDMAPLNIPMENPSSLQAHIAIIGAGLGGFAAALAALKHGETVILTEETDWIGGQLTQQGVPPDEHQWIESHGAPQSYRDFRKSIRNYYRSFYPLTKEAQNNSLLNPGNGAVSRLCHEPKVALTVMESLLAPYISSGQLILLCNHIAVDSSYQDDIVNKVKVKDILTGHESVISAKYFVDATELGDLLPLTGTEYRVGTEGKDEFNELHAPEKADPTNQQAFTVCFAIDYEAGADHRIPKPKDYDFWKDFIPKIEPPWPGKLLSLAYSNPQTLEPKTLGFHPEGQETPGNLNLWNYRRIIHAQNFKPGFYTGDISLVNWPQNDYMLGNLIDVSKEEFDRHVDAAKQLSLSLLYWLQTEAPAENGQKGWPGIRLRKDIMGTEDGLAKYPYIRESRRIKSVFTVTEAHVGKENRKLAAQAGEDSNKAAVFQDAVGIGYYPIDLHPTQTKNYIDFPALPFQIPLGALVPIRMNNLLPANKNIGTTHITNGCYRLHPVEWGIGEAVGHLLHQAIQTGHSPREIQQNTELLKSFQDFLVKHGVELEWPKE